ncbi:MAG: hypothetical protein EHM67_03245 [Hyphomicrobiaceae bacterium]|nr:MAG: hypothetical protein EHM67_03245 [Hyphomicrobiaceae bacterium]
MPRPPSLGAFSDTVEVIYDCALNPQRWRDTLRLVGQLTDTPSIAIGIMDYDQEGLFTMWGRVSIRHTGRATLRTLLLIR